MARSLLVGARIGCIIAVLVLGVLFVSSELLEVAFRMGNLVMASHVCKHLQRQAESVCVVVWYSSACAYLE